MVRVLSQGVVVRVLGLECWGQGLGFRVSVLSVYVYVFLMPVRASSPLASSLLPRCLSYMSIFICLQPLRRHRGPAWGLAALHLVGKRGHFWASCDLMMIGYYCIHGVGCRVQGLGVQGFRVFQGVLGFQVKGQGFRVLGFQRLGLGLLGFYYLIGHDSTNATSDF